MPDTILTNETVSKRSKSGQGPHLNKIHKRKKIIITMTDISEKSAKFQTKIPWIYHIHIF